MAGKLVGTCVSPTETRRTRPAQRGFGSRGRCRPGLALSASRVFCEAACSERMCGARMLRGQLRGDPLRLPLGGLPWEGRARRLCFPPSPGVRGDSVEPLPAAPPATRLCAPRAWGPGSLQTQTVRALFSSPGLRLCLLELIPSVQAPQFVRHIQIFF